MEILPSKRIIICTPPPAETSSGLSLATGDGKKTEETILGKVFAIGEGKLPMDIAVGDTIVYRRYTDNKIFIETEEYNFISFKDIVGVVKKDGRKK